MLDIGSSELEHAIEQACQFMSSGVDGGGCPRSGFDAADKSADGRLTLHGSLGRQPEHGRRAILGFSGAGIEQFAAADAIVRTEFKPGAKVFFAFPTGHV